MLDWNIKMKAIHVHSDAVYYNAVQAGFKL